MTDPAGRPIFFAILTTEMDKAQRRAEAFKVIGAFGFVGGLIVALMGFEMLAMGTPSKAQGGEASREEPIAEDQLIVPFAMPFIAGPGAITIVITLALGSGDPGSFWVALVAVGFSVCVMCISFTLLTDYSWQKFLIRLWQS